MSSFPPLSTLGSAGRPRGWSVERGRGAMRARGHGGAEMAKVGCRVDARARSRLARTEKGKGREMASDAHCARVWCMIAVWHAWLEG